MTAYPPMALAAVCIMLETERTTCRKMAGIPRNNCTMATKMYGDCTRCRRPENRTREISIRVACYNIELVARSHVKDGRLAQDQIATLAA